MFSIYLYTFASVIIVSLISLIGVFFLVMSPKKLEKIIMFLVSLSAGTMLGDVAIHLLPEIVEQNKFTPSIAIWLWLLAGIIVFFILEKIIHWHHCHLNLNVCDQVHVFGKMNLIGDGLHNFIDGAIIASSYLISFPLGITTTIAVMTHEIPQEISDLGVLLHAGYKRKHALFLNFLSGLISVLGAFFALSANSIFENFALYITAFTAGSFIYIATADLIPELKKETALIKTLEQLGGLLLGIIAMFLIKKLG